jgi:hypothetical protein
MDFEQFAPARDCFYLAALAAGAGIGCVLNRYRRKSTRRFRNLTITLGFCFFAGTAAALGAAVIYSDWKIFQYLSIYLSAGILAAAPALAFRFPRAAGFPCMLLSGLIVVWVGFFCLQFPAITGSPGSFLAQASWDGDALVHVSLASRPGSGGTELDQSFSFKLTPADQRGEVLEFRALHLSWPEFFPLIGGEIRGIIVEVRGNGETLYREPRLSRGILAVWYSRARGEEPGGLAKRLFVFPREIQGELEMENLFPGTQVIISFEEDALSFH